MKIKTSELSGAALDWAVAKCEGKENTWGKSPFIPYDYHMGYRYSEDWRASGPIIERERISLRAGHSGWWIACQLDINDEERFTAVRATPLTAAMHCYVASKLGEYVDIPEGLV